MQYRSTTPVKHNGIHHQAGEILDLSEAEAARLLENKAITPIDVPFVAHLNPLFGDTQ